MSMTMTKNTQATTFATVNQGATVRACAEATRG
jgi:hypothetical protein